MFAGEIGACNWLAMRGAAWHVIRVIEKQISEAWFDSAGGKVPLLYYTKR